MSMTTTNFKVPFKTFITLMNYDNQSTTVANFGLQGLSLYTSLIVDELCFINVRKFQGTLLLLCIRHYYTCWTYCSWTCFEMYSITTPLQSSKKYSLKRRQLCVSLYINNRLIWELCEDLCLETMPFKRILTFHFRFLVWNLKPPMTSYNESLC